MQEINNYFKHWILRAVHEHKMSYGLDPTVQNLCDQHKRLTDRGLKLSETSWRKCCEEWKREIDAEFEKERVEEIK